MIIIQTSGMNEYTKPGFRVHIIFFYPRYHVSWQYAVSCIFFILENNFRKSLSLFMRMYDIKYVTT